MQPVVPALRITDADRARAYYVNGLGFQVDWEWHHHPGSPAFLQISRDGLGLYLTEHDGDCAVGGLVYLYVSDVDAWFEHASETGVPIDEPPQDQPWGNRELRLTDPFGNRLCVATVIEGA